MNNHRSVVISFFSLASRFGCFATPLRSTQGSEHSATPISYFNPSHEGARHVVARAVDRARDWEGHTGSEVGVEAIGIPKRRESVVTTGTAHKFLRILSDLSAVLYDDYFGFFPSPTIILAFGKSRMISELG